MNPEKWRASEDVLRLFQSVGRASLVSDIQDSHSGNMAILWTDDKGEEKIVITATGSQKGNLEANQICFLSPAETDFGYYKASSETDIHARILSLPDVRASMHAHIKTLTMVTLDDAPKPGRPPDFVPVDPLAHYHLGPSLPVDWFAVPSGSREMAEIIPERLAANPLTIIFGHGAVAKGRTLQEAFFRLSVAESAGVVVRAMWKLDVDVEALRTKIRKSPDNHFSYPPPAYIVEDDDRCDFPEEEEILGEFAKAGNHLFASRLSAFHTGSMSVRGVDTMLYAPKAARPRDIGGPLLKIPLAAEDDDHPELEIHKDIYRGSDYQTVMHCYLPEAEAAAHFIYPGESEPAPRVVPIDAEGSFLYLVIPILAPDVGTDELVRQLHEYKVVIVRGGGVWAVGSQSLSEVLHHPSSLREICLYRIAAYEQGLDLRKMEPDKATRW